MSRQPEPGTNQPAVDTPLVTGSRTARERVIAFSIPSSMQHHRFYKSFGIFFITAGCVIAIAHFFNFYRFDGSTMGVAIGLTISYVGLGVLYVFVSIKRDSNRLLLISIIGDGFASALLLALMIVSISDGFIQNYRSYYGKYAITTEFVIHVNFLAATVGLICVFVHLGFACHDVCYCCRYFGIFDPDTLQSTRSRTPETTHEIPTVTIALAERHPGPSAPPPTRSASLPKSGAHCVREVHTSKPNPNVVGGQFRDEENPYLPTYDELCKS